jgi:hypothetical protein
VGDVLMIGKPKVRASAQGLVAEMTRLGMALPAPGPDGWHSEATILAHLRRFTQAGPAAQPVVAAADRGQHGPWGDGDPIQWAVTSGRLTASSVPQWRRDYQRDPAGIAAILPQLAASEFLAEEQGGQRVAASARRVGAVTRPGGQVGAYALNPLVDDARRVHAAAAAAVDPAPTIFVSGDIPPVTASGMPPDELVRLPWLGRDIAAAEPDRGKVLQLFESFADDPDGAEMRFGQDPRNAAYMRRVDQWRVDAMSADQLHEGLFGEESLRKAKEAEAG